MKTYVQKTNDAQNTIAYTVTETDFYLTWWCKLVSFIGFTSYHCRLFPCIKTWGFYVWPLFPDMPLRKHLLIHLFIDYSLFDLWL